jgi:hypothetical protein
MKYFTNGRPGPEWLRKRDAIRDVPHHPHSRQNAAALVRGALGPDQVSQIASLLDDSASS